MTAQSFLLRFHLGTDTFLRWIPVLSRSLEAVGYPVAMAFQELSLGGATHLFGEKYMYLEKNTCRAYVKKSDPKRIVDICFPVVLAHVQHSIRSGFTVLGRWVHSLILSKPPESFTNVDSVIPPRDFRKPMGSLIKSMVYKV